MNDRRILYEARLAKEGWKLTCGGLVALVLWVGLGLVLCFVFTPSSERLLPLALLSVGALAISLKILRVFRLRNNTGFYRISIDDHGLYVHSDDPSSTPSFSVIAPDVYRLVRKTIKQYESSNDHEYYIETKSGLRHRIEQLFADYDVDVMALFKKITDQFPWVEIVDETNQ
ncbi:MAG: hypothetical protein EXS18_06930 [Verrucomicrobiae bacterium]|nr:hypothetical protein [Verrucomicrobiae bacterium]